MATVPPILQALRRRWSLSVAVLLTGLGLSSCSPALQLPNVLYIAVGVSSDQAIDSELYREFEGRLRLLEQGYRRVYPNTRFQFSLYTEDRIETALRRRALAGLGPDLLFVNGSTALRLMQAGLVDPFPADSELLHALEPGMLARLRNSRGALSGLPVLVHTQLACFNRKHLPQPPQTLSELLAVSASGHPVGLTVDPTSVFWTVGGFDAVDGLRTAASGREPTRQQRDRITAWLRWLQAASTQQRITFFANQLSAQQEFLAGRLDWIPCRSPGLPRLRKGLGPALGVAPLPNGEMGEASPINQLRIFALGSSSSQGGRERALRFAGFSINPLTQRTLTLGSQTVLPTNRFVRVPVQSSSVLAAMVIAAQQGRQTNPLIELVHGEDPRIEAMQNVLTQLVFGEVDPGVSTDELITALRRQP